MSFRLERLLQIRRRTEEEAERCVARDTAARTRAEEEQSRLAATFQGAGERLAAARGAAAHADTAGDAQGAERFWRRLADEAEHARQRALTHRDGPLAAAIAAEQSARQAHLVARREREALEKVAERQQARQRRVTHRRAEDAAADLALAYRQPKTP